MNAWHQLSVGHLGEGRVLLHSVEAHDGRWDESPGVTLLRVRGGEGRARDSGCGTDPGGAGADLHRRRGVRAVVRDAAAPDGQGARRGRRGDPGRGPLAQAFGAGVAAVGQLGGAQAGDKTMLDALLPAAEALALSFRGAADAARAGAEAQRPVAGARGGPSYLGERSIGHQDPGATSAALLVEAVAGTAQDGGAAQAWQRRAAGGHRAGLAQRSGRGIGRRAGPGPRRRGRDGPRRGGGRAAERRAAAPAPS
ncbi:hypothetical protein SMICM304S_01759 [Streptomyces microflavus]